MGPVLYRSKTRMGRPRFKKHQRDLPEGIYNTHGWWVGGGEGGGGIWPSDLRGADTAHGWADRARR